jgi:hypothetical protein
VILKSAQDLLEKKIYPNYDEIKESAKFFLRESDNEFFSTLGSKWDPYYEKKIRKFVSKIYKLIFWGVLQLSFLKIYSYQKGSVLLEAPYVRE